MVRFLVLALPLALLALGVFHFAGEAAGLPVPDLPGARLLALWILEATGLVGLFLLVRERGLNRWLAGLAGSWAAWIFRGPVLALSATGMSRLSGVSWADLVLAWLGLYTVCGLLVASVAGSLERREEAPAPVAPTAPSFAGAEPADD